MAARPKDEPCSAYASSRTSTFPLHRSSSAAGGARAAASPLAAGITIATCRGFLLNFVRGRRPRPLIQSIPNRLVHDLLDTQLCYHSEVRHLSFLLRFWSNISLLTD